MAGGTAYSGFVLSKDLLYALSCHLHYSPERQAGWVYGTCFTDKEMILRDEVFFRIEVKWRPESCLPPPPTLTGLPLCPKHLDNHLTGKAVL